MGTAIQWAELQAALVVAARTDDLHVLVVRGIVTEVMVVFVSPFAGSPHMTAIVTRQAVRVREKPRLNEIVDTPTRLARIPVAGWDETATLLQGWSPLVMHPSDGVAGVRARSGKTICPAGVAPEHGSLMPGATRGTPLKAALNSGGIFSSRDTDTLGCNLNSAFFALGHLNRQYSMDGTALSIEWKEVMPYGRQV